MFRIFHAKWSSVSVLAGGKGRPSSEYNLYFNVIPKTHWDRRSSITLLSIQYGIYTLHDCLCCSSAAVNMGNLTSILQVHRSAKVQYIVQNGLGQQKKSRILHCTARLQNVALPVSNSNLKVLYKCYDRALTTYINIAKCKLGIL